MCIRVCVRVSVCNTVLSVLHVFLRLHRQKPRIKGLSSFSRMDVGHEPGL